jgi:aromatic ring-opening dioxygenase LigB subunit
MVGCVCPHPPLLIPEIGRSGRDLVRCTVDAMARLGQTIGERETVVVISPHTPGYTDAYVAKTAPRLSGDFAQFGCPDVGLSVDNDTDLVDALLASAREAGVPLRGRDDDDLDHGILVPLSFLRCRHLVSLSVAAPYEDHKTLGALVRRCAEDLGRDVLFLASGDMSHRLTRSAPAGFDPRGEVFDRRIVELLTQGDFGALDRLDPGLVRAAGECGLRSLIALGGFLGPEATANPEVFSYEGPYGVGYLVAAFGVQAAA